MRNTEWLTERDELRQVLEDINSGKIILAQGRDEYVSILKRRIALLEGRLTNPGSEQVTL
jgi:hypothetical protein